MGLETASIKKGDCKLVVKYYYHEAVEETRLDPPLPEVAEITLVLVENQTEGYFDVTDLINEIAPNYFSELEGEILEKRR